MSASCPKCGYHNVNTNTNYKCPECGYKYWQLRKTFLSNHKKHPPIETTNYKGDKAIDFDADRQRANWFKENGNVIFWGFVAGGIIVIWAYYSLINPSAGTSSSESSAYVLDECETCREDLENTQQRISELEDCNEEMSSALEDIQSNASMNAWEDYNTMGDTLDDIDYKSGSYNFCN